MMDKYVLNEKGEPRKEPDVEKWGTWFENADRTVKKEQIGDSRVSTVFLALDHAFGDEEPQVWETMVFGGRLDQEQDRCGGSREQAEAMHEKMVQRVKNT